MGNSCYKHMEEGFGVNEAEEEDKVFHSYGNLLLGIWNS